MVPLIKPWWMLPGPPGVLISRWECFSHHTEVCIMGLLHQARTPLECPLWILQTEWIHCARMSAYVGMDVTVCVYLLLEGGGGGWRSATEIVYFSGSRIRWACVSAQIQRQEHIVVSTGGQLEWTPFSVGAGLCFNSDYQLMGLDPASIERVCCWTQSSRQIPMTSGSIFHREMFQWSYRHWGQSRQPQGNCYVFELTNNVFNQKPSVLHFPVTPDSYI